MVMRVNFRLETCLAEFIRQVHAILRGGHCCVLLYDEAHRGSAAHLFGLEKLSWMVLIEQIDWINVKWSSNVATPENEEY